MLISGEKLGDLPFGDAMERRLIAYARVAGAAGVAALALTPHAKAEVLFTPAHVRLNPGDVFVLDVDGNSLSDFRLVNSQSQFFGVVMLPQTGNNAVLGTNVFTTFNASALQSGILVGRPDKFQPTPALLAASFHSSSGETFRLGQWLNVNNRFIGLKFSVNGEAHFGWARLSVHSANFSSTAVLTGYAYESIPGKPIRTGQRASDTSSLQSAGPTSLGMLALGASGREQWGSDLNQ
jgi:hypothetical protein